MCYPEYEKEKQQLQAHNWNNRNIILAPCRMTILIVMNKMVTEDDQTFVSFVGILF